MDIISDIFLIRVRYARGIFFRFFNMRFSPVPGPHARSARVYNNSQNRGPAMCYGPRERSEHARSNPAGPKKKVWPAGEFFGVVRPGRFLVLFKVAKSFEVLELAISRSISAKLIWTRGTPGGCRSGDGNGRCVGES